MELLNRRLKKIESQLKREKEFLIYTEIDGKKYSTDCLYDSDDNIKEIHPDEKKQKLIKLEILGNLKDLLIND